MARVLDTIGGFCDNKFTVKHFQNYPPSEISHSIKRTQTGSKSHQRQALEEKPHVVFISFPFKS